MDSEEIEDLRRRVVQLEDEREIRYLLGRYGHYADLGYEEQWVDQWSDDAVYDLITVKRDGAGYEGAMHFEGKDQLYGLIRDPSSHKSFEGRSLHLQDLNTVIHIEGDEALAHGYTITLLRDGDGVHMRSAGMVRWAFRRIDGCWRIVSKDRRIIGDGTAFAETPEISAFAAARPTT